MANSEHSTSLFAISQYLSDEIGELKQQSLGQEWPDNQVRVFLDYDSVEGALEYTIEAYDEEKEVDAGTALKVSESYSASAVKKGEIHFELDEIFNEYEEESNYFEQALVEALEDNIDSPVKYDNWLINLPPTLTPFKNSKQEV